MYITVGDLEKVLFELISLGVNEDDTLLFSSDGDNFVNAVTFCNPQGDYKGGVSVAEAKTRLN